jgi:hypothetical protein
MIYPLEILSPHGYRENVSGYLQGNYYRIFFRVPVVAILSLSLSTQGIYPHPEIFTPKTAVFLPEYDIRLFWLYSRLAGSPIPGTGFSLDIRV